MSQILNIDPFVRSDHEEGFLMEWIDGEKQYRCLVRPENQNQEFIDKIKAERVRWLGDRWK